MERSDQEFEIPRSAVIAAHHIELASVGRVRIAILASQEKRRREVVVITIGHRTPDPLVRIQSRCLYGETLGAVDCDCAEQLRESLRRMHEAGSGILIYLDQEGRGAGLSIKAWSYELAERFDLDTFGAYTKAGVAHDQRSYVDVVRVLDLLEVRTCRLLTNNPAKIEALENAGIGVRRESLWVRDDPLVRDYLDAKRREGHLD